MNFLEVESDLNNPSFHSYFMQHPPVEPDPDVNFEKGEVLYDNPDFEQGVSLFRQLGYTGFSLMSFYSLHALLTCRATYPIGEEAGDIRSEHRKPGIDFIAQAATSPTGFHEIDTMAFAGFVLPLVPIAMFGYLGFLKYAGNEFIIKMQYNKERDLLFVTRLKGGFFKTKIEEVYEVAHLQVLPTSLKSDVDLSDNKFSTISCMNTLDSFIVSLDKKYWNPELRMNFQKGLYGLWGQY